MDYTITKNETFNSIEISFEGKPSASVRDALKALKFRWHSVKKVWYGYATEEEATAAIEGKTDAPTKENNQHENVCGVKVGDIFHMSWGYEQTNNDFFQVIKLVGKQSVLIRSVSPKIKSYTGALGWDADITYEITSDILQPEENNVFIKDNINGDLKRVQNKYCDTPYIKMASYADAYLVKAGSLTVSDTHYY